MAKHRSLSLKTFVHSIPWDLFQRYFEDLLPGQVQHHSDDLSPERSLSDWSFLNEEVMEQFLGDSQNAEASGVILEQFRRINDIAVYGANLLVQAYQWAGVTLDSEQPVQELAMRLFLDDPDAFQYAWSRYLLFSTDSLLTSYSMEVDGLETSEEQIGKFQLDLNRWFASQAKGSQCKVHCFQALNSPDLDVMGLTTVGGNARLAHTTRNALRLLEYLDQDEIPVSRGASRPLRGQSRLRCGADQPPCRGSRRCTSAST